jgi:DNA-binding FadR family transcriptional regulator
MNGLAGADSVRVAAHIAIPPIRRAKLSEQAALRLESLIQDGTFPPGTVLPPERELMRIFGVGRTSIREALFALNRMGLIRLRNGERPRVTTPTPETLVSELAGAAHHFLSQPNSLEHFQDARALFEVGVARRAAQRCTEQDAARLRAALEANCAARGDLGRFERADVAFHYEVAKIARNPIFTAVHDGLVGWLTGQRTVSLQAPGAEESAIEGHRLVCEGVVTRDPEAAGRAMEEHLRNVAAFVKAADELGGQHAPVRAAR